MQGSFCAVAFFPATLVLMIKKFCMRNATILPVVILCGGYGCSLQTFDIPEAPLTPNQAVVFDIDGTLTPKSPAVFTVRDDAATAVHLYADKGYKIIYLSARNRVFQSHIPGWLRKHGFPEGSIQVPQTSLDSGDHAAFKTRILTEFKDKGWNLFAAYGDKSTDFEAYAAAGIDEDRVFALRRAENDSCEPGVWANCLNSWLEHLDHIKHIVKP